MAATIFFFMTPEDERAFLRQLAPRGFEAYPEISDPGFTPIPIDGDAQPLLDEGAYYLHLPSAGEVFGRTLRRGRNAGRMEIDEVASAVFHYQRSLMDEETGELKSGRLWAELVAVGDKLHRERKADLLHVAFEEIRTFMKRRFVRSDPPGFFIGPDAVRQAKSGLVLREDGHRGGVFRPHR